MDDRPSGETLLAELDLGPAPEVGKALRLEFHIQYIRDLTEPDMEALKLPRGTKPQSLVRIHSSHHALARCLAMGMRPSEAALVTGYTANRISALQNDDLFLSLIEEYKGEIREVTADLAFRMANLSFDAIEILHQRLHDNPDEFSINQLLELVKSMADRTGHGPGQEIHHKLSMDMIDRPPRESFEDWQERRTLELKAHEQKLIAPRKLN